MKYEKFNNVSLAKCEKIDNIKLQYLGGLIIE